MEKRLPIQNTGKWIFHLQQEQTLQFRIASEQGASSDVLIEGHEISALLDYLYDHREAIYEATHDQQTRDLEAQEVRKTGLASKSERQRVEPVRYFDDGVRRVRMMPSDA
jgi:hypothetical protein